MAVELHLVPQFRVQMPRIVRNGKAHVSFRRPSIPFRELYHFYSSKWKLLEVHCDDRVSIWPHSASSNDTSRAPDLTFDRSQPPDGADDGLLKRNFDGFIAHEAVLDEQYWAAASLRAEVHWESLSYMRHVNTYKRKYAEQIQLRANAKKKEEEALEGEDKIRAEFTAEITKVQDFMDHFLS